MFNLCNFLQGQVTAIPKHSLDVVPVKIFCDKAVLSEKIQCDNAEHFKYLWRNAQQVVESSKNCRTSTTKYQQNFCILIREVLRNNLHLFVDGEKDFLGMNSIASKS